MMNPIRLRDPRLVEAARKWLATLAPPPKLNLSQWAAAHARLEDGSRFRSFAFQDGIQNAFTDPAIDQITVMKSARVGYTQILVNYAGYCIAQAPRRLMILQPTVEDAEDFSKDDIDRLLDWPALKGTLSPGPGRCGVGAGRLRRDNDRLCGWTNKAAAVTLVKLT